MRSEKLSLGRNAVLAVVAVTLALTLMTATRAAAQTETVLFTFGYESDSIGAMPAGGVVRDAAGNFFGTTLYGGAYSNGGWGYGTAYELSPAGGGVYTETILHDFGGSNGDGLYPQYGLIADGLGNLYGTTGAGGAYGFGTVFELSPTEGGGWTETIVHSFNNNGIDGMDPIAGVALDKAGNLYGTTYYGGPNYCGTTYEGDPYNCGVVYELSPRAGGGWSEKLVHAFTNNGKDAVNPYTARLAVDSKGNLYGASATGGVYGYGVAYELMPGTGGNWTEKLLHSFNNNHKDGWGLQGGYIFDASGNLYGTTSAGGIGTEWGTVYELMPGADGNWTEKILLSFNEGKQGDAPEAGVTFDSAGNLYGTTFFGGPSNSGTVFEMSPNGSGGWTEIILHSFSNSNIEWPNSPVILDPEGNVYGTTPGESGSGGGVVFEVTP
jgi:uncharacterized repeat protein (TIGR03803 family)